MMNKCEWNTVVSSCRKSCKSSDRNCAAQSQKWHHTRLAIYTTLNKNRWGFWLWKLSDWLDGTHCNFYRQHPKRKPLLTKMQKRESLNLAKKHENKLGEYWRGVWSDETKINLFIRRSPACFAWTWSGLSQWLHCVDREIWRWEWADTSLHECKWCRGDDIYRCHYEYKFVYSYTQGDWQERERIKNENYDQVWSQYNTIGGKWVIYYSYFTS